MRYCVVCDKDVHPTIDIAESGKPIEHCPSCTTALGLPGGSTRIVTVADKGVTEIQVDREPQPPGASPDEYPKGPTTTQAVGGRAQAPLHGPEAARRSTARRVPTGDPVADAKAQLVDIDRELERLAGLQRQRKRLAAMVAAAEAADREDPEPEPAALAAAE